jgi:hypothetical protein
MSGCVSEIITKRPASANGNEHSNTALITLKTAVLAPIPSANVMIAIRVKPLFFIKIRNA